MIKTVFVKSTINMAQLEVKVHLQLPFTWLYLIRYFGSLIFDVKYETQINEMSS